jgi:membrane-bound lytic murein transglycosylase B
MYRTLLACLALAASAHSAPPTPPAKPAKSTKPAADRRASAAPSGTPYRTREDALRWADEIAERQGLDPAWTRRFVSQARLLPVVQKLMQPAPAGTRKNWALYRSRFIDPVRIAAGVRFWQQHREALARAERRGEVPGADEVAIRRHLAAAHTAWEAWSAAAPADDRWRPAVRRHLEGEPR